jgi:hypothetical protein
MIRAVALLLALAAAAPAHDTAHDSAGRYYSQFPDGLVDGETYTGQYIVEIVPVAPGAAYVRFHLDFYNGHTCSLWGVAKGVGDRLVYRAPPDAASAGRPPCTLTVRREGDRLVWDDRGTCKSFCGERGSFSDGHVAWSSKRPITYLSRLKSSRQFHEAVAAWRQTSGNTRP